MTVNKSALLDYDNVQVLLVGHGSKKSDASEAKKVKKSAEDEEEEAEIEDLEQLAYEDAHRVSGKLSASVSVCSLNKLSRR